MRKTVLTSFEPNIARYLIMIAIMSSIEVTIVCGSILFHVPFKVDPALAQIFFHYRKGFMPERELLLYGAGLITAVLCFSTMAVYFRKRLGEVGLIKSLRRFAAVEGVIIMMEALLVFKLVLGSSNVTWAMLYGVLIASVLIKIFWSEINQWLGRIF